MSRGAWRCLCLWLLLAVVPALPAQVADNAPLAFRDTAEETRFHALAAELRCVKCQNQSLADSNAQIAHDLRREVLVLIQDGQSDAQIKQFLVARYGEFVLYQPTLGTRTWLLWFGPAALLLVGIGVLVWVLRRQPHATGREAIGDESAPDKEQEW